MAKMDPGLRREDKKGRAPVNDPSVSEHLSKSNAKHNSFRICPVSEARLIRSLEIFWGTY